MPRRCASISDQETKRRLATVFDLIIADAALVFAFCGRDTAQAQFQIPVPARREGHEIVLCIRFGVELGSVLRENISDLAVDSFNWLRVFEGG
jgi:hypothetical protein